MVLHLILVGFHCSCSCGKQLKFKADRGVLQSRILSNLFYKIRSVVFDEDKILSIRVYWDQASVLQQLKVIASRKGIPVRGVEQVEALRNPSTVKLNVWSENSAFAAAQSPLKVGTKLQIYERYTYFAN